MKPSPIHQPIAGPIQEPLCVILNRFRLELLNQHHCKLLVYNGNSSFSSLKKYSFYYTLLLETRIRPGLKYGISLCLLKLSYHDQKYYESKLDKFDFFLNAHHMSTSHLKLLRGLKCPLFLRRKSNPKRILYNM